MKAITAAYTLVGVVLVAGTMLLDEVPKQADERTDERYIFTCRTDMECEEEEQACLASGECVRQR